MKKLIIGIAACLISVSVLTACNKKEEATTDTTAAATTETAPEVAPTPAPAPAAK